MKSPLILLLTLFTFPALLVADELDGAKDGDIVRYYEIDFEFFSALFAKWLDQNQIDPNETAVLPRVNPRGLAEAIDIHLKKDQVFRHNIYLGRHILAVSIPEEEHRKLRTAYREILKKDMPTISADNLESLIKRHQETATKIDDPLDPFATTKSEQDSADQPATAPESKPEGKEKPKPESEVRPR